MLRDDSPRRHNRQVAITSPPRVATIIPVASPKHGTEPMNVSVSAKPAVRGDRSAVGLFPSLERTGRADFRRRRCVLAATSWAACESADRAVENGSRLLHRLHELLWKC